MAWEAEILVDGEPIPAEIIDGYQVHNKGVEFDCPPLSDIRERDWHGDMPSPRPGQQSHHGVMSQFMRETYPNYNANKAPAVLMPTANHQATFGVYNTWRAQKRAEMGGTFDWAKITEADMRALSEKMFDAAGTPANVRDAYWHRYSSYINQLINQ